MPLIATSVYSHGGSTPLLPALVPLRVRLVPVLFWPCGAWCGALLVVLFVCRRPTAERREAAAAAGDGRAGSGAASRTNDVVVARGVLQLHAETYAQGDHVAVLSPKSGSPKYIGWICSINSKEVQIRDVRGTSAAVDGGVGGGAAVVATRRTAAAVAGVVEGDAWRERPGVRRVWWQRVSVFFPVALLTHVC